jgi:cobalt-zinc-cadmium efflux system outer membrane protein
MIRFRHGVVLGAVALSLLSGSQVLAAGAGGAGGGAAGGASGGAAGSGPAGAPGGTGSNAGPGAPGSTGGTTPSIPSAGKGGAPSTGTGSPSAPSGQGTPGQGNQGSNSGAPGSPGTSAASGSAPGVAPTGATGASGGGSGGSNTSAAVTVGTGGEVTQFGATTDTTPAPKAEGAVPEGSALPASLSLDDALKAFRSHGLDLLIADAQVRSAEGAKTAAGAVLNPIVNLGYGRVLNYNTSAACSSPVSANLMTGALNYQSASGCSANQWTAGLSDNAAIEDIVSGKRGLRQDVAEAALKATKMGRADAERTIAFQVKSAYFQVVLASQQVDFAKEIAGTSNQSYQLMKLRYDKGAINEGDFAVLETAKLEADQSYDSALQNLRAARVGLGYLLGVRGHIPDFTVDRDTTKFSDPPKLASATQDALVKDAFTHRPDLVALDFQRQRADAAIALAKRNVVPDISLSAQYTQTGTSGDNAIQPPTLSFGITSGLPVFYQQQGEVRQAEADFDVQSLTKAKTQAQIVSDVETAYAGFVTARSLVRRMEGAEVNGRGLLDRAKRARDVQKTRFDKGAASLVEYLDAQRTYIAVNVEYLTDLTNYWTAVAQLEQATGLELKQ